MALLSTLLEILNSSPSVGPTITSIRVTDSGYNNVSSNLTISNSYIKIFGTNFLANSNVFVQNTGVNASYISSSQLRVALPRLTTGNNLFLSVVNPVSYEFQSNTFIDNPVAYPITYLIVAGGGGGPGYTSGGGGAGGLLSNNVTINPGTIYTVTVGAGGAGGVAGNSYLPTSGANSVFSGTGTTITAIGGGYGGGGPIARNGAAGGSGGGGPPNNGTSYTFGEGTAGQGNRGGTGGGPSRFPGAGGGGAGAVGNNAVDISPGNGGIGVQSSITGTATYYAGGGGGGNYCSGGGASSGGLGGGGAGALWNNYGGTSGTANTGGGGGGGANSCGDIPLPGGSGGSGIIILSMLTNDYSGNCTGSPNVTTIGANTILKFTSSGSYTA